MNPSESTIFSSMSAGIVFGLDSFELKLSKFDVSVGHFNGGMYGAVCRRRAVVSNLISSKNRCLLIRSQVIRSSTDVNILDIRSRAATEIVSEIRNVFGQFMICNEIKWKFSDKMHKNRCDLTNVWYLLLRLMRS